MNGIFNKIDEIVTRLYSTDNPNTLRFLKYAVKPNITEYINNVFGILPEYINNSYNQLYELEGLCNLYIFMPDIDNDQLYISEFIDYDYKKIKLIIIPSGFITEPDIIKSIDNLYHITFVITQSILSELNITSGALENIRKLYVAPVITINILKKCGNYNLKELYNNILNSFYFSGIENKKYINYIIENPFEIYNLLDLGLILNIVKELNNDGTSD